MKPMASSTDPMPQKSNGYFNNVALISADTVTKLTFTFGPSLLIHSLAWIFGGGKLSAQPKLLPISAALCATLYGLQRTAGNRNQVPKPNMVKPSRKRKASNNGGADLVGNDRGIQGSLNSCYLDAFLFSIFYATRRFDCILVPKKGDSKLAQQTRNVLNTSIVQPIKTKFFCSSQQVMKLRKLLKDDNPKIMGSFQAIEDVVYLLLQDVLCEPAFINYEGDITGYMHIMLADCSSPNLIGQTQECFQRSMMLNGSMKFANVPNPGFILSLPWHRNKLMHYKAIVPSMTLTLKDLITQVKCDNCDEISCWESQPSDSTQKRNYACGKCIEKASKRDEFFSRTEMKLSSVMCFKGAHFTAFVRNCLSEASSDQWLHFDSMVGGSGKVEDVTNTIMEWIDRWSEAVTSSNLVNWNVRSFFVSAHTCIYEPVVYDKRLSETSVPSAIKRSKTSIVLDWIAKKVVCQ